jgi:phosphatidylglycerol:prolipoprotein diacylglycerol transferase
MIDFFAKLDPVLIEFGNFSIKWYAVFILVGALLTYYVSQRLIKKDGYPTSVLENTFYIAFPAGLVGARIWWYFFEGSNSFGADWYRIFFVWEGGLSILGGVLFGFLAGYIYFQKAHPEIKKLYAMDIVIPNILIAQALGRWGNFFNQEVYGACVTRESLWFLPDFITNQMAGGGLIACPITQVAQPLFLYEMLLNVFAFFMITFVLRKIWRGRRHGDLAALYFIWYGVVRTILEPLRHPDFIMTKWGIPTSLVTAILFALGGLALLLYTHRDQWLRRFQKR